MLSWTICDRTHLLIPAYSTELPMYTLILHERTKSKTCIHTYVILNIIYFTTIDTQVITTYQRCLWSQNLWPCCGKKPRDNTCSVWCPQNSPRAGTGVDPVLHWWEPRGLTTEELAVRPALSQRVCHSFRDVLATL